MRLTRRGFLGLLAAAPLAAALAPLPKVLGGPLTVITYDPVIQRYDIVYGWGVFHPTHQARVMDEQIEDRALPLTEQVRSELRFHPKAFEMAIERLDA